MALCEGMYAGLGSNSWVLETLGLRSRQEVLERALFYGSTRESDPDAAVRCAGDVRPIFWARGIAVLIRASLAAPEVPDLTAVARFSPENECRTAVPHLRPI